MLIAGLRLSPGEAARRLRAAQSCGPRRAVTGEVLAPARPILAAAQRAGEVNPEQVAIIERAMATVDHRGFDPADLDRANRSWSTTRRRSGRPSYEYLPGGSSTT